MPNHGFHMQGNGRQNNDLPTTMKPGTCPNMLFFATDGKVQKLM